MKRLPFGEEWIGVCHARSIEDERSEIVASLLRIFFGVCDETVLQRNVRRAAQQTTLGKDVTLHTFRHARCTINSTFCKRAMSMSYPKPK